ncbi:MAG TPA: Fe(3+) ABC transporter substrate-binding protein [Acidiferrobacterales bacterium]|nr:Fe(3+) ABC transporter substrate-binding protein [Acidiferrobacterales bacterium]
MRLHKHGVWLAIVLGIWTLAGPVQAAGEVNLYSARKEELIKPLLDKFTVKTGIKVNLVTGKEDALLERLKSEGRNSPADLLLTSDAGRLHRAQEAGVLAPVDSARLRKLVPAHYRDPQGHWFGLSVRARPIAYVTQRVHANELSTYEALAERKWKGRICIRSSDNIYNQSLVASMIAHRGVAATEAWARGFVANFARAPVGGDRDQVLAAAAGQCDVVIVNTYYLAAMLNDQDPAQRAAAQKLAVFWPNQKDRGAHVNVSGIGLTAAARHRDSAVKLIEYLAGAEAQAWYAEVNHEYPIRPDIPVSKTLAAMGKFKADTLNLHRLGQYNAEAVKLMDRAGWK